MKKRNPVVIVPGFGNVPVNVSDRVPLLSSYEMLREREYKVIMWRNNVWSLRPIREQAEELSRIVDGVLEKSKAKKVDIIGISMGGIVTMYYLHYLHGAEKVDKFIAVASPFKGTMAALWGNLFFGLFTPSLAEISPWSRIISDLWKKPRLSGVKFYTITGLYDCLAPPHTSRHKFAVNTASLPFGHWWLSLALDKSILDTIDSILAE